MYFNCAGMILVKATSGCVCHLHFAPKGRSDGNAIFSRKCSLCNSTLIIGLPCSGSDDNLIIKLLQFKHITK